MSLAFPHGVASGEVTDSTALLWTRLTHGGALVAEVSPEPGFAQPQTVATAVTDDALTAKVELTGLTPNTTYFFRFRTGDDVSEPGHFRTAPAKNDAAPVRFGWVSDTDGSENPPLNHFEALDRLREDAPDFWVYLGDTVYMDMTKPYATTLDAMRGKYALNRTFPALRNLFAASPTYVVWDDHEVENDFNPETVSSAELGDGERAFEEFMPLRPHDPATGYFRTFRWGREVELFVLDERSFRSVSVFEDCGGDLAPLLPSAERVSIGLPATVNPGCPAALADPSRTFLGAEQKQRFLAALRASDATWKVVVNEVAIGELFFYVYDRWEGYAAERQELIDAIAQSHIRGVVFITGDYHGGLFTPVRTSSGATVAQEFTTGAVAQWSLYAEMSADLGSDATADAALQLLQARSGSDCVDAKSFSYGLIAIDPAKGTLTARLKSDSGAVLCEKTLTATPLAP